MSLAAMAKLGRRILPLPPIWNRWSKIVVLSPHSDDAAFSIPVTLRGLADCGKKIELLTCFSISAFTRFYDSDLARVTALRKAEDLRYARTLHHSCTPRWLDHLDAPLRGYKVSGVCHNSPLLQSEWELVGSIAAAAMERLEKGCAVLAPLGIGSHVDHRIIRDVSIRLADMTGVSILYYEEMPYASTCKTETIATAASRIAMRFQAQIVSHVISTPVVLEVRKAAADCYPSQVAPETIERIFEGKKKRRYATERVWEVRR
jgi:LmbE family N-acetylglucosaminyl deacetylase